MVGDSVTFHCTKENADGADKYPVDWKHRPVGGHLEPNHFFGGLSQDIMEHEYLTGFYGRYNVTRGEFDMILKDVKPWFAGTYFCWDLDAAGTNVEAELIVIGNLRYDTYLLSFQTMLS